MQNTINVNKYYVILNDDESLGIRVSCCAPGGFELLSDISIIDKWVHKEMADIIITEAEYQLKTKFHLKQCIVTEKTELINQ